MKYKLINKTTGEEHICEKVVIDGWDYYVSDNHAVSGDFALYAGHVTKKLVDTEWTTGDKKVIATNNPSIDVPQVVDEVDIIGETACEIANVSLNWYKDKNNKDRDYSIIWHVDGIIEGYNKSQETHPNSDSDTAEFAEWLTLNTNSTSIHGEYIYKNVRRVTKELIQIWKEQRPKILYYE
ncbi:MAG: hypothetical protein IM591_12290 [Chitinophagaceae bacterium]|uniref:hypothetical protein n=1 Tax=Microcystis sp. M061S2 TaxID=2771171 RepID=UPI0025856E0A|nr:hypothetical protein [Microcystis sp. M061S2]MCA2656090.1 hypothetical protein [Microcystis sp. M061S2]MCA6471157.1 hypothetical protein [Chitinophagaceae bacterium]